MRALLELFIVHVRGSGTNYLLTIYSWIGQDIIFDKGGAVAYSRNRISKQVRCEFFCFSDGLRLLNIHAGMLTQNLLRITSAFSMLYSLFRDCYTARPTTLWSHKTISCCLAWR